MKSFYALLIMVTLFTTGCSFIPRLTFDTKGTVPQTVDKHKIKQTCKGTVELYEDGTVKSCSKGYSNYQEGYNKVERKYTLKEKIINLFSNLTGFAFWIVLALIIFIPGFAGWLIGKVFNGVTKAFEQTVAGIKKFRQSSTAKEELDTILRETQDDETKKIIAIKRVDA